MYIYMYVCMYVYCRNLYVIIIFMLLEFNGITDGPICN